MLKYVCMYDVIIVGGGFSALIAANRLAEGNLNNFIVLEKNDRVGKKILVTGNGRCNLTNAVLSVANYHGADPSFAAYALKKYDNRSIAAFFENRGLLLAEEDGRFYPLSKVANAVSDALRFGAKDKTVTGAKVTDIERASGAFVVKCADGRSFEGKKVILAFGGRSGQGMGTDGSSYILAQKFGHGVTKLSPSLVQLKTDDFGKGLKGIKQFAKVALYDGYRHIRDAEGDFLIADGGVSGNTVFTLSAAIGDYSSPRLMVDFIPTRGKKELVTALKNKVAFYGGLTGADLLTGCVHSRMSAFFAEKTGISKHRLDMLGEDKIEDTVALAKDFSVKVTGTFGFSNSQVTHGGIKTEDVDDVTYESKLEKGVYIIGEALDVDGDCGGYNLQFAYSSAMCAAEHIL